MTTAKEHLNQILPLWQQLLQQWSRDGSLVAAANQALQLDGPNARADAQQILQGLVDQWAAGDFSGLPPIELLSSSDISGAQGAYAISMRTIYLNADWLTGASQESIEGVFMEELGHHLDAVLKDEDTLGDEGDVFSGLLRGQTGHTDLTSNQEDSLAIFLEGEEVVAEASSSPPLPLPGLQYESLPVSLYGYYGDSGKQPFTEIGYFAIRPDLSVYIAGFPGEVAGLWNQDQIYFNLEDADQDRWKYFVGDENVLFLKDCAKFIPMHCRDLPRQHWKRSFSVAGSLTMLLRVCLFMSEIRGWLKTGILTTIRLTFSTFS